MKDLVNNWLDWMRNSPHQSARALGFNGVDMFRYISALFILLNLTSCVGYAIVSGGDKSELDSNCRGNMYCINEQDSIRKVHGEPDKIIIENNKEYWVYNKKMAFRGVLLGLIVPVPIIIPVGYDKAVFEFENGKRIHTTVDNTKTTSAYLCGIIFAGHAGFGCYVQ